MKKLVSVFLTMVMLLSIAVGSCVTAKANTKPNYCKVYIDERYSNSTNLILEGSKKAMEISSLSAGSKKFTVKWKKSFNHISGYQIQYATDKKFKKNKKSISVSKSKTSKTVTGLKANKTYYVRIRAYYKNRNNKFYSAWSKAKSVKVKGSLSYSKVQCEYSTATGKILGDKVGSYYYYTVYDYESDTDYLLKRKSEDEEPTVLLNIDRSHGYELLPKNVVTNGSTIYFVVYSYNDYRSIIYKMSTSGKDITQIHQQFGTMDLIGFYNNCIYYMSYDYGVEDFESIRFCKYNIKTEKYEIIYENAWDFANPVASSGRYMIFRGYTNDYENVPITVYDAKEGKKKAIANGINVGISGSTIYYCTMNIENDYYTSFNLYCCDINGKNKKTVKKCISSSYYPTCMGKDGMFCICWDEDYNETDYFFSYKDKTMKKIS